MTSSGLASLPDSCPDHVCHPGNGADRSSDFERLLQPEYRQHDPRSSQRDCRFTVHRRGHGRADGSDDPVSEYTDPGSGSGSAQLEQETKYSSELEIQSSEQLRITVEEEAGGEEGAARTDERAGRVKRNRI